MLEYTLVCVCVCVCGVCVCVCLFVCVCVCVSVVFEGSGLRLNPDMYPRPTAAQFLWRALLPSNQDPQFGSPKAQPVFVALQAISEGKSRQAWVPKPEIAGSKAQLFRQTSGPKLTPEAASRNFRAPYRESQKGGTWV